MSEIPKRIWLVAPCDDSPGWDEAINQDGSQGDLFISADALRELVKRNQELAARLNRAGLLGEAAHVEEFCDELEKLLDGD